MRRAALKHIGGWLLFAAALVLLVAGTDTPNATHEAWFWWLKAGGAALAAAAFALLRRAQRAEADDGETGKTDD